MKKYIALAALFAAGSAFANAEVTTVEATFDSTYTNASWNIENFSQDFWAVQVSFGAEDVLWNKGVSVSLNESLNFIMQGSPTAKAAYFGLNYDSTDHWTTDTSGAGAGSSQQKYYTDKEVTLINNDGELTLWIGDTQFAMTNLSTPLVAKPSNTTLSETLSGSLTGLWGVVDSLKVATFDAADVVDESAMKNVISTIQEYSPIPEPSVFGLLAGLGALALVGTRRRRR